MMAAKSTRDQVKKAVGTYSDHKYAIQNPNRVPKEMLERAYKLATLAIQVQWVNGDAKKAEASFFKINQQAVQIDQTELRLIRSRSRASALAARAIMRSGTGHKYWSRFSDENQQKIEEIAKEIHDIIFMPKLKKPIKTLDLPIAGPGYSQKTQTLILDLINLVNDVKSEEELDVDLNGDQTISFLIRTRKILQKISGNHPSSLGLHPAVYFYSPQGRYQSTSLLAMVQLIKDFQKNDIDAFIENRRAIEDFILKYRDFVQQLNNKSRTGMKGYKPLKELYQFIIENVELGMNDAELIKALKTDRRFSFLKTDNIHTPETERKEFSRETKSEAFMREALRNPIRCKICGGLVHINSISIDHINRIEDGGLGVIDNAQITHPYCNTTYKN